MVVLIGWTVVGYDCVNDFEMVRHIDAALHTGQMTVIVCLPVWLRAEGTLVQMLRSWMWTQKMSKPSLTKKRARQVRSGWRGVSSLTVRCDITSEVMVTNRCPSNAGSISTSDHRDVFDQVMDQLPVRHRGRVLVRIESA